VHETTPIVKHTRLVLPAKAWAFAGSPVAVRGKLPYGMLDGDHLLGQEPFNINAQTGGYAQAEMDIGTAEVAQLARDNLVAFGPSDALHRGDDIIDKVLSLGVGQHVAKEIPGLGIVVVVAGSVAVVPVSDRSL
jgi:hypothetical protein